VVRALSSETNNAAHLHPVLSVHPLLICVFVRVCGLNHVLFMRRAAFLFLYPLSLVHSLPPCAPFTPCLFHLYSPPPALAFYLLPFFSLSASPPPSTFPLKRIVAFLNQPTLTLG
jgi:hypothetical protein